MISSSNDIPKFSDVLSIQSNPEDLFTLICPIGKGGFGKVYKAIHNTTQKIFAIKIIDYTKNCLNNKSNISINYNLMQEETNLMRLTFDNDFILKYYGSYYSRKENTIWLILEYCSCGSLIDLMETIGYGYSEMEIASIMEMVLRGLIFLHDLNIIHRDIKAQNILLSEDGCAKIADFGVGVKLTDEEFRHSKKGSFYWMSPQVVSLKDYDTKTDIWSLGITCIELAETEPPFADLKPFEVANKLAKSPPTVEDVINVQEYSGYFVDFLDKCLQVDPNKRFSAKELIEHDFIKKFSKGKGYIAELVKKHKDDVEIYMKTKCDNKFPSKKKSEENDDNIDDIDVEKLLHLKKKDSDNDNYNNINNKKHSINNKNELIEEENDNIDNDNNDNNGSVIIKDKNTISEEINNSTIIKENKKNEELPDIFCNTEKMIQNLNDGLDLDKKMIKIDIENNNEEGKDDKEGKEEEKKPKEINNNNIKLKTPYKKAIINKDGKEQYYYSNNIKEKENNKIKNIILNENNNKKDIKEKDNISKDRSRSGLTTGFTGSKTDSSDGKNFKSNNILAKFESTNPKRKINFINQDLSNIDDDSDEEQINQIQIKTVFNINKENNILEKSYEDKKYLRTAQKQCKINFLDKKQIDKYVSDFNINSDDGYDVKKIHFSAYKQHKKYFD